MNTLEVISDVISDHRPCPCGCGDCTAACRWDNPSLCDGWTPEHVARLVIVALGDRLANTPDGGVPMTTADPTPAFSPPEATLAGRLVNTVEQQCAVLYLHPEHVVTTATSFARDGVVRASLTLCPGRTAADTAEEGYERSPHTYIQIPRAVAADVAEGRQP